MSGNTSFILAAYIRTSFITEILPTAGAHDTHFFSTPCLYKGVQKEKKKN